MSAFPEIRTVRSILKRISNCDISILKEIFEDEETQKNLPELYTLIDESDGVQKFISAFDTYSEKGDGYLWGIHSEDKLLGFVAVVDLSCKPTLFYAMHPECRSQGYMKESVASLIDFLRDAKICQIITTEVYRTNEVSLYVLRSLGFDTCNVDDDKIQMSMMISRSVRQASDEVHINQLAAITEVVPGSGG